MCHCEIIQVRTYTVSALDIEGLNFYKLGRHDCPPRVRCCRQPTFRYWQREVRTTNNHKTSSVVPFQIFTPLRAFVATSDEQVVDLVGEVALDCLCLSRVSTRRRNKGLPYGRDLPGRH